MVSFVSGMNYILEQLHGMSEFTNTAADKLRNSPDFGFGENDRDAAVARLGDIAKAINQDLIPCVIVIMPSS